MRSRPVLRDPAAALSGHQERLQSAHDRLRRAITARLREEGLELGHAIERVRVLSPRATLRRGYAILTDAAGKTVTGVAGTGTGDRITAHLADGRLGLTVTDMEPQEQP